MKKFLSFLLVMAVTLTTSCAHRKQVVVPTVYPTIEQFEECCSQLVDGCDVDTVPSFVTAGPNLQIVHVKKCIDRQFIFAMWVGELSPANKAMERFFVLRIMELAEIDAEIIGSKNEVVRQETSMGPLEVQVTIFELKDNIENSEQ